MEAMPHKRELQSAETALRRHDLLAVQADDVAARGASIDLRKLTKTYPGAAGGFTALNQVDLKFRAGEYVAIVGKSGSGKSTLLNMLTGIDHPSTGTVVINGLDVHTLDESSLARWRGKN